MVCVCTRTYTHSHIHTQAHPTPTNPPPPPHHTWSVHSKKVEGGGVLSASVSAASGITSATPMADVSVAAARITVRLVLLLRGWLVLVTTGAAGSRKALAAPAASSSVIAASVEGAVATLRIVMSAACGSIGVCCLKVCSVCGISWMGFCLIVDGKIGVDPMHRRARVHVHIILSHGRCSNKIRRVRKNPPQ